VSIQGNQFTSKNHMLLVVRGSIPELATDVVETHSDELPHSFQFGKYSEIKVNCDSHSKIWPGWKRFEENEIA